MPHDSSTKYLPRTLEPVVREVGDIFNAVLISGAGGVGKSTLLNRLSSTAAHWDTLNLENIRFTEEASLPDTDFFDRHPLPLVIENIDGRPKLLRAIKVKIDEGTKPGEILITSRQRFASLETGNVSFAGRLIPLTLLPLSIYEREGQGPLQKPYLPTSHPPSRLAPQSEKALWQMIWQGAWPGVIRLRSKARSTFYERFLRSYLERDMRLTAGIEKIDAYLRFLVALSERIGEELHLNALSQAVGVSPITIKKWLFIAEATGIVYRLSPYYAVTQKQLVKSPKIYFTDTGLAAWLRGLESPEKLRRDKDAGLFFENFVVIEILKSWVHNGEKPDLSFLRESKRGCVVTLLIRHQGTLYPITVSLSSHPDAKAVKDFKILQDLPETIGHGAVISMSSTVYSLTPLTTVHSLRQL